MDRRKIFIPVSEDIARRLSHKYPGLPPMKIREIISSSIDKLMDIPFTGRTVNVDRKKRLAFCIAKKPGYNFVPKSKAGNRAVSYIDLGTELEFVATGELTKTDLYSITLHTNIKNRLKEKANDVEFINQAL